MRPMTSLAAGMTSLKRGATSLKTGMTSASTLWQGGGSLKAALFGAGEAGFLFYPPLASNFSQDAAGATPVAIDADPVGRLLDLSGNGNHATQATGTQKSIWRANGSKPYLSWDGADDRATNSYIPGAAGTIAVACRLTGGTGAKYAMGGGGAAGNKRLRLGFSASSGKAEFTFNDQFTQPSDANLVGIDVVLVQAWGGGIRKAWINTTLVINESRAANMDGTGTAFTVGSLEGGTSSWFQGRTTAFLARSVMSTDAEVARIVSDFQRTF